MSPEEESPEALREEIRRLQEEVRELRERERRGFSRKILLTGGAGALAGAAGASLLTPATGAIGAPMPALPKSMPGAEVPGAGLPTWFYLQIVGSQQGRLIGDLDGDGLPDLIVGRKLDSRMSNAVDLATGAPAGKRQHQPLVIVKDWGASSPQLARAMVTGEVLTSVAIFLPKMTTPGAAALLFRIDLQNARLARFRQYVGTPDNEAEPSTKVLEELAFTFQRITWSSVAGKTQASDSWQTG